eukprot:SAG11_NODE_7668_length_1112_cov_4.372162_2_plen_84_part_00
MIRVGWGHRRSFRFQIKDSIASTRCRGSVRTFRCKYGALRGAFACNAFLTCMLFDDGWWITNYDLRHTTAEAMVSACSACSTP